MKRKHRRSAPKQEIPRAPTLCVDIANHMHADLTVYDDMTDYWTLIAWHQTCRAYHSQWRDPVYLKALLLRMVEQSRRLLKLNPLSAQHAVNLSMLDIAALTTQFGEAIYQCCDAGIQFWTWPSVNTATRCTSGISLKKAFSSIITCEKRLASLQVDNALPRRLQSALRGALLYVERKYGWIINLYRHVTGGTGFARKTEIEDVNPTSDVFLSDAIQFSMAPALYKK